MTGGVCISMYNSKVLDIRYKIRGLIKTSIQKSIYLTLIKFINQKYVQKEENLTTCFYLIFDKK